MEVPFVVGRLGLNRMRKLDLVSEVVGHRFQALEHTAWAIIGHQKVVARKYSTVQVPLAVEA